MGLLDDAIREHLELKRRHGADPTEVERQEREALGPVRGAAPEAAAPPAEAAPAPPPHTDGEPDDDAFAEPDAPAPDIPVAPSLHEHHGAVSADRFAPEPDLDWSEPAPVRDPEPSAEADPEDVLEETPEFLEETPEHDRLWFEQRPPKDFDF